jgi:hypothetical protein
MVKTSTPKNYLVTSPDAKFQADLKNLKPQKPSQLSIKNILSYSKALKIEPSELVEEIVTINN